MRTKNGTPIIQLPVSGSVSEVCTASERSMLVQIPLVGGIDSIAISVSLIGHVWPPNEILKLRFVLHARDIGHMSRPDAQKLHEDTHGTGTIPACF